ncbi:hypothetical protein [Streptomyces atratus]|uniref:hypothetical protein n=1 Tax=Streptomyces atratus TaxID=1893 RepID=UPI00379B425D
MPWTRSAATRPAACTPRCAPSSGPGRERLVFRDPARSISLTSNRTVPTALPSDRIAGLLDRLDDPHDRLMVAPYHVDAQYRALLAARTGAAPFTSVVQRRLPLLR